jgi:hypothetical protein
MKFEYSLNGGKPTAFRGLIFDYQEGRVSLIARAGRF